VKTGVQRIFNYLENWIPAPRFRWDKLPRNDRKPHFQTSYEFIKTAKLKMQIPGRNSLIFKFDGFAKSFFCIIFVIPAKAGIQVVQVFSDSCSRLSLGQASQE